MKKNILGIGGLVLSVATLIALEGCNRLMTTAPVAASNGNNNSSSTVYTPPQSCAMLGSDLYNFYKSQSGNILFSPFSIITCVAMAQEGAVGPTQTQMQNVLYLNPNNQARWTGFQQLINEINAPSKPYTLATADNMWPQQGFAILPAFTNTLQTYYDSGVTALDYVDNAAGAVQTIDGAVSQETDGYIPQLLTTSDVNSLTRLVLTNAVYFQADWQNQFVTTGTNLQNFTLESGATESVSMMNETLTASIGSYNGAASVVALPYKNDGASMYIFLPPAGGMATLEGLMTGPNITSWLSANAAAMTATSGSSLHSVNLSLPKFTFSTNYNLSNTLSSLGMPLAFSLPGPNGANFSGIDGNLDLYISKVIHQAYIDVNESGTTAAAATAVIISYINAATVPLNPVSFNVDRPFIFMILDNVTNTVLFMGRVDDPLSTS
jgi:serpin B